MGGSISVQMHKKEKFGVSEYYKNEINRNTSGVQKVYDHVTERFKESEKRILPTPFSHIQSHFKKIWSTVSK